MKKNIFIIFNLLVLFAMFFSCSVGLGPALNLTPPETKIMEPVDLDNFRDVDFISGTASDKYQVSEIIVSIENTHKENDGTPKGTYWKMEWRGIDGTWQQREQNGNTITEWSNLPVDKAEWTGTNFVVWKINDVHIPDPNASGEFLISAYSINNVKNESPIAQVRVIIDNEKPKVKINLPILAGNDLYSNIYNAFELIRPFNHAHLDRLHNTSLRFSWEVEEDYALESLRFELRDSGGTVHWNSGTGILPVKNGSFIIPGNELPASRTYLRFVSYATDGAGNTGTSSEDNDITPHGWLIWDPDGNIPWSVGFGQPNAADAGQTLIYTGSPMYGQAYDNESVAKIEYRIYQSSSLPLDDNNDNYNELIDAGELPNISLVPGEAPSRFFNVKIPAAPSPIEQRRYKIVVTTFDNNGISNLNAFYFQVYVPTPNSPLFAGFANNISPGIYGTGAVIDIILNFRDPVLFNSGAFLGLNIENDNPANPPRATLYANNGSNEITFRYTVQDGDRASPLRVLGIDYTTMTQPNPPYGPVQAPNELVLLPGLEMITRVEISTTYPTLQTVNFDQDTSKLTLTFNKTIVKGLGNIEIFHEDGELSERNQYIYLAPAVLSRSQYLSLNSAGRAFFYRGTNGANVIGNTLEADTSERYILNYGVNTNDSNVITAMKYNNLHKLTIPMTNEAVELGGVENNSLIITLNENTGFVLPVKGVRYYIHYDEGIVLDSQNNRVEALKNTTRSFPYNGVNPVYFRVRRTADLTPSQRFENVAARNTVRANQPFRTVYKIDCQTPTATIQRSNPTNQSTGPVTQFATTTGTGNATTITGPRDVIPPTSPVIPTEITTAYTRNTSVELGPASSTDNTDRNGYIYHIAARASLAENGTSEIAYLRAARSVVQYTNFNSTALKPSGNLSVLRAATPSGERLQLWIRGGDNVNGGENSTPGFPISWNENDLSGAALLTHDGNVTLTNTASGGAAASSGENWYWITWDVNATAYFQFLAGTTLSPADPEDALLGPRRWTWSVNRYAQAYRDFPLHPGGSISLNDASITYNMQSWSTLNFSTEYRTVRRDLPQTP